MSDAIKKIEQGEHRPYIVFYGEDAFLKEMGVRKALDALNIQMPELNLNVFEDRPDTLAVARAMETLPFLSERKAVLLKDTDLLSSAAGAELLKPLETANMAEHNVLIISATGKLDKRKSFVKFLEKNGMLVECAPPSDREVVAFIISLATENQLMISQKNAQFLCDSCGGDLHVVSNEIKKLACVCRGTISQEEIETYASKSMQYNVYKIHDLFCARQPQAARVLIEKMLDEDPNPVGFITLLANNFRQMLVARACRDAKFSDQRVIACICEETGAKEWAARRAVDQCRSFTAARLRAGIAKLARLDFNAKQGMVTLKTDLFALLMDVYQRP